MMTNHKVQTASSASAEDDSSLATLNAGQQKQAERMRELEEKLLRLEAQLKNNGRGGN